MTTLTIQEEENMLIDKLQSARHALEMHKKAVSSMRFEQNALEKQLEEIEQSCIDYMTGNGLVETERLRLGTSASVDVPDVDAVPEQFIREKITREPNKILISEAHKSGKLSGANWYTIKQSYKLTLKGNA